MSLDRLLALIGDFHVARLVSYRRRARIDARAVVLTVAVWAQQQQPQIGIAPVAVAAGPYVYDTAEQHRIRVVVVAQGLPHPFSLAFLANGDALVTERGGKLRLVRGATGPTPVLQPEAIGGTPQQPPSEPADCRKLRCTRSSPRTSSCTSPTTKRASP